MKKTILTLLAVIISILVPRLLQARTQSALYDAIAIMNAGQRIHVIMMPDGGNMYKIFDPVTGTLINSGMTGALDPKYINAAQSQTVIREILIRNAGLPPDATDAAIDAAYAGNPFLRSVRTDAFAKIASGASTLPESLAGFEVAPASGLSSVTLLNNLANGTADFLIRRGSEELSVAVIQRLQKFLSHYPEFDILFPKTIKLIEPISAYDYAKTLNALKAALQDDLDKLPSRVQALYPIQRYQVLNKKAPALTLVFAASTLSTGLNSPDGLSKILHDMDTCSYLGEQNNYASFFHILSLCSDNLRKKLLSDADDGNYPYFSASEINQITNNDPVNKEQLIRLFLGLLYQQGAGIPVWTIDGQTTCGTMLAAWASDSRVNLNSLLDAIGEATGKLTMLDSAIREIKEKDAGAGMFTGKPVLSAERVETYNRFMITSLEMIRPFLQGTDASSRAKQEFRALCQYWPEFSGRGLSMVQAITQKNYSLGVQELSGMIGAVVDYLDDKTDEKDFRDSLSADLSRELRKDITLAKENISAIDATLAALKDLPAASATVITNRRMQEQQLLASRKQLQEQLDALEWQNSKRAKTVKSLKKLLQYYQLFASLSTAENSQEVESLLEAYALPSGSSRVKKETDFNIAVNAYIGAFFARQNISGTGFTNEYGFTAPIGFTISRGFNKAGSVSLLLGVFDIGGVVKYKLNNRGAYEQDIKLSGLVSPCTQLAYGFPFYLPISVGAGCQWTSPVEAPNNNISLTPHFNAFVAVDVPLFNITAVRKR